MRPDGPTERELKAQILESLRAIRETATNGLSDEEALGRALALLAEIGANAVSPENIVPDDAFKDVLYSLVYRVLPGRRGTPKTSAVRSYLKRLAWDESDMQERATLVSACGSVKAPPMKSRKVDAPAPPSPISKPDRRQIYAAFERALPLIRTVLAEVHELSDGDGNLIEGELLAWFERFCRREAACLRNPGPLLLAAASTLATDFRCAGAEEFGGSQTRLCEFLDWALAELDEPRRASRSSDPSH